VYIIDWHDDIFCDYALRYCVATTRREKKVWYIITPRVKYNIRLVFFLKSKDVCQPTSYEEFTRNSNGSNNRRRRRDIDVFSFYVMSGVGVDFIGLSFELDFNNICHLAHDDILI